jgi:ferredoxin-NADP reductase/CRP-like cAMP-binding protein
MKIHYLQQFSLIQKIRSWIEIFLIRFGFKKPPSYLFLKHTHLFDDLDKQQLSLVAKSLIPMYFAKDQLIFNQGDVGDHFYIIQSGSVGIFTHLEGGKKITLARLEEGDFFGEQALIGDTPQRRSASAEAIETTTLLALHFDIYSKILGNESRMRLQELGHAQLLHILDTYLQEGSGIPSFFKNTRGIIEKYADGEVIFRQNEPANRVYFIISGGVVIELAAPNGKTKKSETGIGALFGESGVLNQSSRIGTAAAKGNLTVFAVEAEDFRRLYENSLELQRLVSSLNALYKIEHLGTVRLHTGTLYDTKARIATYHLEDGSTVYSIKAIDRPIFTLSFENRGPGEIVLYSDGAESKRSLLLVDRKIKAITSIGKWPELSAVCGLALDRQTLSENQIARFKKEGQITDPQKKNLSPDERREILCECMKVSQGKIFDVIGSGENRLEEICHITGAGNVCGCCRPKIVELLGLRTWMTAKLVQKIVHTPAISSFRFSLLDQSPFTYRPGQHIIIQSKIDKRLINRAYTLTSISNRDNLIEITVKKEEKGAFSPWLFEGANEHSLIRISIPQGKFTFTTDQPILFFAAGIGITPAIAFARSIIAENSKQTLHIDYSYRDQSILKEEWEKMTREHKNLTLHLRNTQRENRISPEEIVKIVNDHPNADIYICGTQNFEDTIRSTLKALKIAEHRIKTEKFVHAGGPDRISAI